ncbi:N-alpha-acetyltransferase 30 [Dunckerocampus dactyliophorus]|uniref:N-alpha-acetyltransferase 30 n=1 Tax=Dunckerocampus dactyliophorus TaxID=161453 RepID=UPI002405DC6E|nr:N-alpha-acetyltransferase 30 [Dunckerocampus dactyliophorus]
MATVPPGPSSALPASPAESPPFPGAGSAESGCDDGGPRRPGEEEVVSGGAGKAKTPAVCEPKQSIKKKQTNMLARPSQPALHLQAGEQQQQQLNGLASPLQEPDDHPFPASQPGSPRPSVDNCDNDGNDVENCQHEGPLAKNGNHSPLVSSSMNGMPDKTRTLAVRSLTDGADLDHNASGPVEPGTEEPQPPTAELARLDLSGSEESYDICYVRYESELQMPWIMRLITKDLSEPYSIYTYRYFIHNWPQLCFLAMVEQECVGAIVCKLDLHKKMFRRGYIAMLAVDSKHRRKSIGTNLVKKAIYAMVEGDCDEVVLETEITNKSALKLYENLGFVRDKRLFRYYLNGVDALRLKLWLR